MYCFHNRKATEEDSDQYIDLFHSVRCFLFGDSGAPLLTKGISAQGSETGLSSSSLGRFKLAR
jgi:hypothetical protein